MPRPRNAKEKCSNCPKPPTRPPKSTEAEPARVLQVTSDSEGERLWNHVLFGTGTCLSMIEGYHQLGMPGDPKETLISFRDRLQTLINKL